MASKFHSAEIRLHFLLHQHLPGGLFRLHWTVHGTHDQVPRRGFNRALDPKIWRTEKRTFGKLELSISRCYRFSVVAGY